MPLPVRTRHFRHFRRCQRVCGAKPFWLGRMQIRHFHHFRQNHLFLAGIKARFNQNTVFVSPIIVIPESAPFAHGEGKVMLQKNPHDTMFGRS